MQRGQENDEGEESDERGCGALQLNHERRRRAALDIHGLTPVVLNINECKLRLSQVL